MDGGDALERWAAEARADDAIAQRLREVALRRQARDDVSLAGVAADLAERGSPVALTTGGGRVVRGVIRAVAVDHLDLATPGGRALVPMDAVVLLEGPADQPLAAAGDRRPATPRTLAVVLAEWADERPDVRLELRADLGPVHGRLARAGADVIVVDRDGLGPVVVALTAVAVVWCPPA